ncbi:MAG: GNAT family N-acetyltransferase [Gammaproteobacteria bacterium]|nr:GNAT family N-acetyltransferase [Gammaproteobacteria bacterium]
MQNLKIRPVDYHKETDCQALTTLLSHYAEGPMGGGEALDPVALARLCANLAELSNAFSILAWHTSAGSEQAVGLANCFEGYSTFKAKPLINIHDLIVHANWRNKGIGQLLLTAIEQRACRMGACKITLEVLSGNQAAIRSYVKFGFAPYTLDARMGEARFMQKELFSKDDRDKLS